MEFQPFRRGIELGVCFLNQMKWAKAYLPVKDDNNFVSVFKGTFIRASFATYEQPYLIVSQDPNGEIPLSVSFPILRLKYFF